MTNTVYLPTTSEALIAERERCTERMHASWSSELHSRYAHRSIACSDRLAVLAAIGPDGFSYAAGDEDARQAVFRARFVAVANHMPVAAARLMVRDELFAYDESLVG
ncbi:MAG: hypothetical protein WC054_01440 [Candidatus Nanopelagicales bacterium]